MSRAAVALLLVLAGLVVAPRAHALETVRLLVPDRDNLQYMSFWVAREGGFFEAEGIDVEIVSPPGPQETAAFFEKREAEVAVLPPPVYLALIADKEPVVLVANLLKNDPIDLVVRREVLAARGLSRDMPLRARLEGLRGVRIGVAPHPPSRLRALYASHGLDADRYLELVILHGKEQNAAFAERKVDALYAHTPYLERAIVRDDAVVFVEQTVGEALANRQIHALCVTNGLLERRRDLVVAMVRAIARAEAKIHASQPDTIATLARAFPSRDRRELETIVRLYEPAIPTTPDVRADDLPAAVALFPAGMPKPELAGIDLTKHVAPDVARAAAAGANSPRRVWGVVGLVVAILVVGSFLAVRGARRRAPRQM